MKFQLFFQKKFIYNKYDAVFYKGPNLCTKFDPLNDFFKQRASYHFKA